MRPTEWQALQVPSISLRHRLVAQPPLHFVADRPRFFRRQPVALFDRYFTTCTRGRRVDLEAVQRHHPGDGALPAFGRGAPERDARQLLLVVGPMAAAARLHHRLIGNRDAGLGLRARGVAAAGGWAVRGPAPARPAPAESASRQRPADRDA